MVDTIRRKKVMVVDDSDIVLAVSRRVLESAGFDVITHPRPAGCIALILQETPDLLLIDVNMPGLNGDTVVKMLGSTQVNSQMVVLLHSSLQDELLAQKAKAVNAHGYIRKSDNPQMLVREVSRWIRPTGNSGAHSLDSMSAIRASSGTMLAGARVSNSPELSIQKDESAATCAKKILLVDHDMLALSEYRKLTKSVSSSVEFALSGNEALRRLEGNTPPDVVVLGKLISSPGVDDILNHIARLGSRWRGRCIVLNEDAAHVSPKSLEITRVTRPVTEASLCRAIQGCVRRAS